MTTAGNTEPLNEAGTILVAEVQTDATCAITGHTIAKGDHALFIRPAADVADGQQVVSAKGLPELEQWLQQLPDGTSELQGPTASPAAERGEYAYLTHPCLNCGASYDYGEAIVFAQNVHAPWCHQQCRDDVLDAIEGAWSHADRFLTDHL